MCYRLYDEADFLAQPEYTDPEIRRTNLAAVVLQMRAFGLGDIETFPFLDPPEPRAVRDALTLLTELGALVDDQLTPIGRTMARLPIDPRLGRMLVEASAAGRARGTAGDCERSRDSGSARATARMRAARRTRRTSNSRTNGPTILRI